MHAEPPEVVVPTGGRAALGVADPVDATDLDELAASPARFLNRELSWLDFNARVLALASNPEVPLLERAKFVAIFSQNLDEFFQVRIAGLKDQVAAGVGATTPDGRTAAEQLADIRSRLGTLVPEAESIFLDELVPALAEVGIVFSSYAELDDDDRKHLDEVFDERIFPVLTPLGGRPGPPLPLHLGPVAEPGGGRARPPHRREALRPGEGPEPAAPLRGHARRRALRAPRAGHRRPPRRAVPGHGGRHPLRVPGHPQRRPHPRGGGGRRPARRGRAGAAPPALRAGGAPRGGGRGLRRDPRPAHARARPRARSTSTAAPARST